MKIMRSQILCAKFLTNILRYLLKLVISVLILSLIHYSMNRFRLPRIVLWSLSTGFIFLVWMTLMRLGLFFFFNRQSHSFADLLPSFFLGFRFDLKIVCILILSMLVIGSVPRFN